MIFFYEIWQSLQQFTEDKVHETLFRFVQIN